MNDCKGCRRKKSGKSDKYFWDFSEIANIQAAQLKEEERKKALKEQILKNVAMQLKNLDFPPLQSSGKKPTTDSSKRRLSAANNDKNYMSVSSLS